MKIILSSDWHFGNAGNSPKHNLDLLNFIDWMINWSIENNVTHFANLGDLFHSRDKLDVQTIEYALEGVKRLNKRFGKFKLLKGNHDLYLRDSRDICSLHMFQDYADIVDKFSIEDNCLFTSWICNAEEYDELINVTKEQNIDFVMGHFEFQSFAMNDHYIMEHGQSHKELSHVKNIFTGHYHGRQIRDNVVYIGNPFPFDFNDSNDMNKGFCVLDTETGEYEFINYEKIAVVDLTPEQLLEQDWSDFDQENISVRVVADDDVSHETLDQVKELFEGSDFRNTKLVYSKKSQNEDDEPEDIDVDEIMSVDQIVMHYIDSMDETEKVKPNLLREMYQASYS